MTVLTVCVTWITPIAESILHNARPDNRIDWAACQLNEIGIQYLRVLPLPFPQIEVTDSRHRFDVSMDTRPEFASGDTFNLVFPILIRPPS